MQPLIATLMPLLKYKVVADCEDRSIDEKMAQPRSKASERLRWRYSHAGTARPIATAVENDHVSGEVQPK